MNEKYWDLLHKVLANIGRYIVSIVFVFSGFVKIIDPLGFYYKVQDYAEAFHLTSIPDFFLLSISFMLSLLEFLIGLYLFFGVRRRISILIALSLMVFMTPLTFILALTNPISDCGCFGDAVVMSNWETFGKNIVLLAILFYLRKQRNRIVRFFSIETNWIVSTYCIVYIFALGVYCLYFLPVLDFRPFKVGVDVANAMSIPEGAEEPVYETIFIMEKGGKTAQFTLENYPDSTWSYVDSETKLISAGYIPAIQNFSISDINTGEDVADSILAIQNYQFILVAHRIDEADDSNIDLINEIYDYSKDNNYNFICLTSSPIDAIEEWQDKSGAEYPFYQSDDITLKTIIRSNPGLLLLKDGVIFNKWDHHSLPDEYELSAPLEQIPLGIIKHKSTKNVLLAVVGWFFGPLLIVFGIDKIYQRRKLRRQK